MPRMLNARPRRHIWRVTVSVRPVLNNCLFLKTCFATSSPSLPNLMMCWTRPVPLLIQDVNGSPLEHAPFESLLNISLNP